MTKAVLARSGVRGNFHAPFCRRVGEVTLRLSSTYFRHVVENKRSEGLGTKLVNQVIEAAKEQGCYKLVATSRKSRPKVHQLYERLGFKEHGLEFRIDLQQ